MRKTHPACRKSDGLLAIPDRFSKQTERAQPAAAQAINSRTT